MAHIGYQPKANDDFTLIVTATGSPADGLVFSSRGPGHQPLNTVCFELGRADLSRKLGGPGTFLMLELLAIYLSVLALSFYSWFYIPSLLTLPLKLT